MSAVAGRAARRAVQALLLVGAILSLRRRLTAIGEERVADHVRDARQLDEDHDQERAQEAQRRRGVASSMGGPHAHAHSLAAAAPTGQGAARGCASLGAVMRVTLLGHSSVLIEAQGRNILVDPVFSEPFGEGTVMTCPARKVEVANLPMCGRSDRAPSSSTAARKFSRRSPTSTRSSSASSSRIVLALSGTRSIPSSRRARSSSPRCTSGTSICSSRSTRVRIWASSARCALAIRSTFRSAISPTSGKSRQSCSSQAQRVFASPVRWNGRIRFSSRSRAITSSPTCNAWRPTSPR